jgi:hypothetical protein
LTVGRLLFEHISRCERDRTAPVSAPEFAKALQTHAEKILERLKAQQHDDLKLFDARLDARLTAVSQSRFFSSVAVIQTCMRSRRMDWPWLWGCPRFILRSCCAQFA